jgi:hypothetical protein
MGDIRRFDRFANLVLSLYPYRDLSIADVASGKGYLSMDLNQLGYNNISLFDTRARIAKYNRLRIKYSQRLFTYTCKERFDIIIGMHPDEATDHIILYAVRNRIPFIVCPCCVKPSASQFNQNYKFWNWVAHLENLAKGFTIKKQLLPIGGKNLVLIGTP